MSPPSAKSYDVVVYGGTAAGVMAAIAAAQEGVTVALLEPGRHIGGMVSGGLGYTDAGRSEVIGGLALEFYSRVAERYGASPWAWVGPEPHVAEEVFAGWLEQAGVSVYFHAGMRSAQKADRRVATLQTGSGEAFEAVVFVDAGYEGDLVAGAGVSYSVGREGVAEYGESWAGRQPLRPGQHNFDVPVSPFREGSGHELLPLMHDRPLAGVGEADDAVQAYGFRLCLTRRPENRLPIAEPQGYDPGTFELLRRYLSVKGDDLRAGDLLTLRPNLPNDKCDVNSKGPVSTNLLDGSNWAYPEAEDEERAAIRRHHLQYTQGLVYFLASDRSVPGHIRREMEAWGLCKDEFADTEGWPHQLYVREGRRMLGEFRMTQRDLQAERVKYDAVGLGSYHIDVRETQRVWDHLHLHPKLVPAAFNEGYLSVPVEPYEIPYRALLPRYQECENLLVPVCLSVSHIAFASIRMEPQYMILGHSAGTAAAMAVRHDLAVQRVPVADLQQRLVEQGQRLSLGRLAGG